MSLTSVSTITVIQDDDDGSIVLFQGRAEQHNYITAELRLSTNSRIHTHADQRCSVSKDPLRFNGFYF